MVGKWLKLVNKSGRKEDILVVIDKIINKDFVGLDIVPMENQKGYYKSRVGKLRIIFFEKNRFFYIDKVGYRGDVYK